MQTLASYSLLMTNMKLLAEPQGKTKSRIVVTGAEREAYDGPTTKPLILGSVRNTHDILDIAKLILDHREDIAASGEYRWDSVSTELGDAAKNLWSICWTKSEEDPDAALPRLMLRLGPNVIAKLHTIVGIPTDRAFLTHVAAILGYLEAESIAVSDLIERHGPIDEQRWFGRVGNIALEGIETDQRERERRLRDAELKIFGDVDLVSDAKRVVTKFGEKIPPGFLLHMTRYSKVRPGVVSDALLLSWGRLKVPLPENAKFANSNNTYLPSDLIFLHWLLANQKAAILKRIGSRTDTGAVRVIQKLRSIAKIGREALSKEERRKGGNFKVNTPTHMIASIQASVDPDRP